MLPYLYILERYAEDGLVPDERIKKAIRENEEVPPLQLDNAVACAVLWGEAYKETCAIPSYGSFKEHHLPGLLRIPEVMPTSYGVPRIFAEYLGFAALRLADRMVIRRRMRKNVYFSHLREYRLRSVSGEKVSRWGRIIAPSDQLALLFADAALVNTREYVREQCPDPASFADEALLTLRGGSLRRLRGNLPLPPYLALNREEAVQSVMIC